MTHTIVVDDEWDSLTWQEQRKQMIKSLKKFGFWHECKEITCDDCPASKDGSCEWAWDCINTDGYCLAEK